MRNRATTWRPPTPRVVAPVLVRIQGYITALERRRRRLENSNVLYRDQHRMYLMQLEAISENVDDIRRVVLGCRGYLQRLAPQETAWLKPYACILKLSSIDYLLTEILLNVAMHAEVCASVSYDRVQLHLTVRAALPAVMISYNDTVTMLIALLTKGAQPQPHGESVLEAEVAS
ncbi:MAG: hypothetical protein ABI413_02245 [Ktedonobacteraceae bacterium]